MDKEKILKAGQIAKEVREWIKPQIKKGTLLLEIAEKIEEKIKELGGKPAFPVNLSINEIAAHYSPSHNDKTVAHGILKVDFGVHVDGWPSDQSFSLDMEGLEENKKLIESSSKALENVLKILKAGISTKEIGNTIQESIESSGFHPIVNLSGHGMEQWELHSGVTIPNIPSGNDYLKEGLYAIEPFATPGNGKVKDGRPSEIYQLENDRTPRSPLARQVLRFIKEEYETLPFCSRWIIQKFGLKSSFAVRELVSNGNIHNFSELVEASGKKVSQKEHTVLIENGKITVTTL